MSQKKGSWLIKAGIVLLLIAAGLIIYNIWDAGRAEKESAEILGQLAELQIEAGEDIGFYMNNPEIPMAEVEVNKISYIGSLDIPALGLTLPVASESSKAALRLSPCRYSGSVYSRDLIISGHNYRGHFSSIRHLQPGEKIVFTDNDGNQFNYTVLGIETVDGRDVETMLAGEWDLTLYTCTLDGRSRLTVRAVMDR